MYPPPALPRLASIKVPTLVLVGEHDIPDVHAHAGAIAAGIRERAPRGAGGLRPRRRTSSSREAFVAHRPAVPPERPVPGRARQRGTAAAARLLRAARATNRAAVLVPRGRAQRRGYRLLALGAAPDAIAVFRLNTEAFPASANTHDSLGEALLAAGDRDGATAAYRKALEIDPASESARAALQSLGVLPPATGGGVR